MTRRGTRWAASSEAQSTRCAHHSDWLTGSPAAVRHCNRMQSLVVQLITAEAVSLQGIIFTAGIMWNFLQKINVPIHVQEVSLQCTSPEVRVAADL